MPKVIITPNPAYDPLGVRMLLSSLGVKGPMLQDETTITCIMTEQEISTFRNGRGAAHGVQIVTDPPPAPTTGDWLGAQEILETDDEPPAQDPASLDQCGGDAA